MVIEIVDLLVAVPVFFPDALSHLFRVISGEFVSSGLLFRLLSAFLSFPPTVSLVLFAPLILGQ